VDKWRNQLQEALDNPCKAAKGYVEKLLDANILYETTGYARNRVFQAKEIFDALEKQE
jgi:hypothetical protein